MAEPNQPDSRSAEELFDAARLEAADRCATLCSILFTSGEVVEAARLREFFEVDEPGLEVLAAETAGRLRPLGLDVVRAAEGYRLVTSSALDSYVRQFHTRLRKARLSRSALEILAIVAYEQPIERSRIDEIRQVNSESTVRTLLDRHLIKVAGRSDGPGRPFLYRTTAQFLEVFGLDNLDDLPPRPAILASAENGEAPAPAERGIDDLPSFDDDAQDELE